MEDAEASLLSVLSLVVPNQQSGERWVGRGNGEGGMVRKG